jgi:hypothetical protein
MTHTQLKNGIRIGVVTAVNENPEYRACITLFNKQWRELDNESKFSWTPIVVEIDKDVIKIQFDDQSLHLEVPSHEIPTSWLAQIIRLLVPGLLPYDFVVCTDVDMMPLDTRVFENAIRLLEEGEFEYVVCRDVLTSNQYPICYNIAAPEVWQRLFSGPIESQIMSYWREICTKFDGRRGKQGWFYDQELLFRRINYEVSRGLRILKLKDNNNLHCRLEPTRRNLILWPWVILDVAMGRYSDYHLHRPIEKYRLFIWFICLATRWRVWAARLRNLL